MVQRIFLSRSSPVAKRTRDDSNGRCLLSRLFARNEGRTGDISRDMAAQKLFTRSEIEKNKDMNKTLIILHDKVYDVHMFLNEHPGGEEILIDHKGKDSSEDFDDIGHSKDAMELMKKYQVGMLVESERNNTEPKKGWVTSGYNKIMKKQLEPSVPYNLLIGGFVFLLAVLYYLI